jgi:putative ABC transport system permease protein
MFRNYLKTTVRALQRRKSYALLNVAGLAVGLAAVILIGLWVQDELSYDDFHEKSDRTYRVLREFNIPDLKGTISGTPPLLAPTLRTDASAVEQAVRIYDAPSTIEHGARTFVEPGFIYAEDGFFEMFSFEMLRGEAALEQPGTVVLTEAMAQKYFSGENPIGQTITNDSNELKVTGVMENVPANSHFDFTFVGSLETLGLPESWGRNSMSTYLTLTKGTTREEAATQVDDIVLANTGKKEAPEGGAPLRSFIPHLQPLTGIHLGQGITEAEIGSGQVSAGGSMSYVWLFGALAGFVLLLACINFTNLATARSAERAGEVGMRKALGAQREQLAGQFLGEALLLSSAATLLALLLARAGVPLLNALSGKELALGPMLASPWALALPALALAVGLAAGAWPAFVLSAPQPAEVLRGTFSRGKGGRRFRQGLVVFQFVVSIALIAATAVVYEQLGFMQSKGLGFEEENVVVIEQAGELEDERDAFTQELAQLPGVERVAGAFSVPGKRFTNSMWRPATPGAEQQNLNYSWADFGFFETMEIEMKAGRSFSASRASDSLGVVLNEAALTDYGWTAEEALGKQIQQGDDTPRTVIGVAENFHYEPLHEEIYPMALFGPTRAPRFVAVRLSPQADAAGTLSQIGATWEQFSDLPLDYSFLADDLAAQYEAEQRLARVLAAGALLAVLVACLGLFGLAAFTAERRTKEIAVRKALGASVTSIVGLLSKDFLKLVAVGFALAVPLAWYGMRQWLSSFAYHAELGPFVFVAAGALALLVALATVSWQALRAARLNPADALRDE